MKENSIEEDIKIVENYLANSAINEIESNFFKNGGWETIDLEIPKSMQHILSDYKRVLKENEEVHKENEHLHREINRRIKLKIENEKIVDTQFISIQKIKDKIKEEIKYHEKNILDIENVTMLKSKTAKEEAEIEFNKYAIVVLKKMLQELIEEREEK